MRVALLEDDPEVARAIAAWLSAAGHAVAAFGDGRALLAAVHHESYDVFLLDWQVPGASGERVLRSLRDDGGITAPVLFVSARDAEEDVASILGAGADDYLVKPIRRLELLARITAVARRLATARPERRFAVGPYGIDLDAREVRLDGARVDLTDKEFDLAAFLFGRPGALLSKGHVAQAVWGHGDSIVSRTVDVHVSKLRRKLQLGPERGVRLSTIYGFGYRLERVENGESA